MDVTAAVSTTDVVAGKAGRPVLEEVRDLLDGFRRLDRSAASDEQRLAWVDQIRELSRRVTALSMVLVGEADEAGSSLRARHTRLEDWMTRSGQETAREASGAVWTARALEKRPVVRDAAAKGQISIAQAKAIGQALEGLPISLDRDQKIHAEQLILKAAEHAPADILRGMTEQILRKVAPDQVDTPEQRAAKLEARDLRARLRRKVWFGPETDGSIDFGGSLPVVAGRRLQNLVQAVADRRYRSANDTRNRAGLQETPQQRAADALVDILDVAQAAGAGTASTTRIPVGAQIQVLIPYQDLLDRATSAGLLMDGTPISPGELRILACGADLIPAILGTHSQVLDFGREVRLAPPWLRRAIGLRDGGCAFPGCRTPIRHCDLHHVIPWQEGGPTDRANIVGLCRVHHTLCEPRPPITAPDGTLVDQDGWDVRMDAHGLPEFLPPLAVDPTRTPIRRLGHAATLFNTGPPALTEAGPRGRTQSGPPRLSETGPPGQSGMGPNCSSDHGRPALFEHGPPPQTG